MIIYLFIYYCDSERKYDIEVENLDGKYKEWQKKLHPDLVHSKSEVWQSNSSF
jgi:hypothetical protein